MQCLQVGGSVFECKDCNTLLHEYCAQSTTPFLCNFCLRKKWLRENKSKTDDTLDREEGNSEEEKEDGIILEACSASPSSSENLPEAEYTTQERLVAEPFSIGGQNY